jgi:predicted nucleotidyltransferase component of viral defense system
MMSLAELMRVAEMTGFQLEALERVACLFEILESLRSHPFLQHRIALKGGTALNAFVLPLPRLSVDIDLNYIGSGNREVMLAERPKVEQAVAAVCSRLGIQIKRMPAEHAGGKWQLSCRSGSGRPISLALDMNFLMRMPLWPYVLMDSQPIGSLRAERVPVLDLHELAAGKLTALFSRNTGRDLFDACNLLQHEGLDQNRLRLGFVVYGGTSRRDWRTISLKDVKADLNDVSNQLIPMLQSDRAPAKRQVGIWTKKLIQDCRKLTAKLLPLQSNEMEFLDRLNGAGEIAPELLSDDAAMQTIISAHPALQWKAQNVREYMKSK